MAINSNAFAGEVPPKLDPPATPVMPQYVRADADRLLQAANQVRPLCQYSMVGRMRECMGTSVFVCVSRGRLRRRYRA